MKFNARLQRGSETVEHPVELIASEAHNGLRSSRIGEVQLEADCEEIVPHVYSILIKGRRYEAFVSKRPGDAADASAPYIVAVGLRRYLVELHDLRKWRRGGSSLDAEGPQEIVAPMPGKVIKLLVKEGEKVERGQGLLVIEAMKMQNELKAPREGRVERIYMEEGRGVESGARLVRLI